MSLNGRDSFDSHEGQLARVCIQRNLSQDLMVLHPLTRASRHTQNTGSVTHPQNELQCHECGRRFCEGDKTRHKCITEHQKPISGSAICPTCNHWFCSQGWQPCSNTDTTANRLRHQNKSKPLPAGRTGTMSWVSTLVLENKCMIKPNQTQMHSWKTKTTDGTVVITTCEIWAEVWLYRCEPNI